MILKYLKKQEQKTIKQMNIFLDINKDLVKNLFLEEILLRLLSIFHLPIPALYLYGEVV
jgi:hypothetical protein